MDNKDKPSDQNPGGEKLHSGHRQRMRDRYRAKGLEDFAPHEVLEMLLYRSIRRGNTNPAAHTLLDKYGTLENVLPGNVPLPGVGEKTLKMLQDTAAQTELLFQNALACAGHIGRTQIYMASVRSLRRVPDGVFLMVVRRDGTFQEMATVAGYTPSALLDCICSLLGRELYCHIAFLSTGCEIKDLRRQYGRSSLGWVLCLSPEWHPVWG